MASVVQQLIAKGLLKTPPSYLENSVQLEVVTGSVAYGVSNDTSDMDVVGFCIPSRHIVFPHLAGEIEGFSTKGQRFDQFQQHGIVSEPKNYDLAIYNITRFFRLCMDSNPNMVDTLFVPRRCVLYSTGVGELVRENRHMFLSKQCWPKFKGYAYSQLHKMKTKQPVGKRVATVKEHGYDVKFAYHVVRLLDEVGQLLTLQDMDITRSREQLKAIRRGEWTQERVMEHFETQEKQLERAYADSQLPDKPDEEAIKNLLVTCLEHHYGTLEKALPTQSKERQTLRDIQTLLDRSL